MKVYDVYVKFNSLDADAVTKQLCKEFLSRHPLTWKRTGPGLPDEIHLVDKDTHQYATIFKNKDAMWLARVAPDFVIGEPMYYLSDVLEAVAKFFKGYGLETSSFQEMLCGSYQRAAWEVDCSQDLKG